MSEKPEQYGEKPEQYGGLIYQVVFLPKTFLNWTFYVVLKVFSLGGFTVFYLRRSIVSLMHRHADIRLAEIIILYRWKIHLMVKYINYASDLGSSDISHHSFFTNQHIRLM